MLITPTLRMASKRTYQDALTALNSLQSNYANIMAVRQSGDRKNRMSILEMYEWSRRLGYKVSDFNKLNIVHITGTKGKGSTAAFTSSILQQYQDKLTKIGLYTSPHLRSVRERIRINGEPISESKFTEYFFQVWDKLDKTTSPLNEFPHMVPGSKPGYFKFLTLLSFHAFMKEECSCCVYEVGVGGELDSTNIIEKPVTCGVSLLGIDHTFMLGDTIEEIAWNKGGIFKKDAPAYTIMGQEPAGLKVLQERAKERETSLTEVPTFKQLDNIKLGIAGDFQKTNASLAVVLASQALNSLSIIKEDTPINSDSILPEKFITGLKKTIWEGRCQYIKTGKINWYIDGAHTKESIEAASRWFAQEVASNNNKKILLFNQQTRDAALLLKVLHSVTNNRLNFSEALFTTNVTWKTGSYNADLVSINVSQEQVDKLEVQKELASVWKDLSSENKSNICANIESAINIIEDYDIDEVDVFVTGSLHLVGGFLVVLDKYNNQ
ncbi:MET7 [Nakaseomyces glabratus]|nr:MET7 [Nakaseomyces glabratus]UCS26898.1 MET7 [Nakaseomyces glabratus]UCS32127.1 MET7 [Nakaseomyces glabratus]UCS37356.1 MET7 [Nakaseomyces glabratus]